MRTACICILVLMVACNDKPDVQPRDNSLAVYPNPVREIAYISFANPDNSNYSVVVFDTKGDVILQKDENLAEPYYQVNVADEPIGTYHVVLKKNSTTIVRQFTKTKQ